LLDLIQRRDAAEKIDEKDVRTSSMMSARMPAAVTADATMRCTVRPDDIPRLRRAVVPGDFDPKPFGVT